MKKYVNICCSVLLSVMLLVGLPGVAASPAVDSEAARASAVSPLPGPAEESAEEKQVQRAEENVLTLSAGTAAEGSGLILPGSIDGSEGNDVHLVSNLYDGDLETKWLVYAAPSADNPIWTSFQLSEAAAIQSYSLTVAAESDLSLYDRDPMNWTFEGSHDGENWDVLDTRVRQQFTGRAAGANQTVTYSFENGTAYLYYKLNITANTGSSSRTQLAELSFSTEWVETPQPEFTDLTGLIDPDTLTGSTEVQQAAHDISHLIDGTPATKWLLSSQATDSSPVWASFGLVEASVVNRYTVVTASDQTSRDPKSWTFEGSVDGEEWVVLDTRSSQSFSSRYGEKTFLFSNDTAYSYYKLNITENNGATDRTHIAELSIGYAVIDIPDWDYTPLIMQESVEGAVPQNSSQTVDLLFDNDVTTKALFNITPSADTPVFVTFCLSEPRAVSFYSLSAGIDGSGQFPRDPCVWTFEGSNDGQDWTVLDIRSGEDFYGRSDKLSLTKNYYFTNDTPYLYYKLNITANNGAENRTQLAELKIGRRTPPEADPLDIGDLVDPDSIQSAAAQQGTYLVKYLFDGYVGTKCLFEATPSEEAPIEISFGLTEPRIIDAYSLSTAEDQSTFFSRDPRDWTFEGSNDGQDWTVLDTRSGEDFSARENNTASTTKYTIDNTTAYAFYRLVITANNGATNNRTQLSELRFYSGEPADYTEVNAAIAEIPSDLTVYSLETVRALQNEVNAVVWDLPASEQETVDGYASRIREAISALREITIDILFEISEGMVTTAAAEGKYDITWNAHILAGEETSYEDINSQIQIQSYGVYYAASEEEIQRLLQGQTDALAKMVVFDSGEDIDVYTRYGFRLKNVAQDRLRTVVFYISYLYEGQSYTICSVAQTSGTFVEEGV